MIKWRLTNDQTKALWLAYQPDGKRQPTDNNHTSVTAGQVRVQQLSFPLPSNIKDMLKPVKPGGVDTPYLPGTSTCNVLYQKNPYVHIDKYSYIQTQHTHTDEGESWRSLSHRSEWRRIIPSHPNTLANTQHINSASQYKVKVSIHDNDP